MLAEYLANLDFLFRLMIKVNYPPPSFRIKTENGRDLIFDEIRRKWIVLTPEEWVRQNFISFIQQELKYASTLIAVEKELQLGELKKRFDILVYDSSHQPWMMVECKEPGVKLGDSVLSQALRYHLATPVQFIVITNGNDTYAFSCGKGVLAEIGEFPQQP